tara:strand:- start:237 stop:464 length:228 start_codon:yes stop_codon:yes gene_type:complete
MDLSNLEMTCLCDKENPKRFKYKDRLLHYELQSHKIMMKTMSQYPLTKKEYDNILVNEVLKFVKDNEIKIKVAFN